MAWIHSQMEQHVNAMSRDGRTAASESTGRLDTCNLIVNDFEERVKNSGPTGYLPIC